MGIRATSTSAIQSEREFLELLERNRQLICKVCYMYATDGNHFNDLYQEVVANMWQGRGSYRGEAACSTWIYRIAINTCVTYYRRTRRHSEGALSLDSVMELPADLSDRTADLRRMYQLIASLEPVEKALIMMWLDERTYDEISSVTGMTRNNVALRLRRIKLKLVKMNE